MVTSNRILLVCPPFQGSGMSSLSTAHLATYLRHNGVDCAEAYPHIELARMLGKQRYDEAGKDSRSHGELFFAEGRHDLPLDEERETRLAVFGTRKERDALRDVFLKRALAQILDSNAEFIGFSTSFNQLMASLFIAREIKQADRTRKIVLGGASCAEPMGRRILEAYDEVDYIVSGPGEKPLLGIGRGEVPRERLIINQEHVELESMPVPEYENFLGAVAAVGWPSPVALTFETSRGCWWGQKHHCRFCGVNGAQMRYGAKSPARATAEIRELWDKHGRNLFATDAIMPSNYADEVMPQLGAYQSGPKIFYELKSPMREVDICALARARVQGQPGLESLSSHLLQLLNKGGSGIRNVAFLKWSRERGLAVGWNQLFAIPGENVADYDAQIELMKRIVHLAPPTGAFPIRIARFSPYFDNYREFGWSRLTPTPEYRSWHPHLDDDALMEIAAFFSGEGGPDPTAYEARFRQAIDHWIQSNERGDGLFLHPEAGLVRNEQGSGFQFDRHPVVDAVIAATHEVVSLAKVIETTRCGMGLLKEMERLGLIYIEQDSVINLAVRTNLDVTDT